MLHDELALLASAGLRPFEVLRAATLNPAKSDPIFYFVYPVAQMLDLKRRIPIWSAQLRYEGFEVEVARRFDFRPGPCMGVVAPHVIGVARRR